MGDALRCLFSCFCIFLLETEAKTQRALTGCYETLPGSCVEQTQLCIFVPRKIPRNKETVMGDCTWTFGDRIETDSSRVFFVNKKFSVWHETELMIITRTSNAAWQAVPFWTITSKQAEPPPQITWIKKALLLTSRATKKQG